MQWNVPRQWLSGFGLGGGEGGAPPCAGLDAVFCFQRSRRSKIGFCGCRFVDQLCTRIWTLRLPKLFQLLPLPPAPPTHRDQPPTAAALRRRRRPTRQYQSESIHGERRITNQLISVFPLLPGPLTFWAAILFCLGIACPSITACEHLVLPPRAATPREQKLFLRKRQTTTQKSPHQQ